MNLAKHSCQAAVLAVLATFPSTSRADETIRIPGDHPDYHIDIEPHGVLGWSYWDWDVYGVFGFGGGVRFSMPLCKNCFIPKINNNVAISFGADLVFYPLGNANFVPTYLVLPVAMQWNFFVHKKWSVGPEIGFAPTFGVFYDYGNCNGPCHNFWFAPLFAAVGRYHFNDKVALTMRLGFPEFFNIGVSFWL
jgi:hypothetical protein